MKRLIVVLVVVLVVVVGCSKTEPADYNSGLECNDACMDGGYDRGICSISDFAEGMEYGTCAKDTCTGGDCVCMCQVLEKPDETSTEEPDDSISTVPRTEATILDEMLECNSEKIGHVKYLKAGRYIVGVEEPGVLLKVYWLDKPAFLKVKENSPLAQTFDINLGEDGNYEFSVTCTNSTQVSVIVNKILEYKE